jgi:diguanylate cyclase (GGDEF)-like protein
MNNPREQFLARLESLRSEYIDHFPSRIQAIEQSWNAYDTADDQQEVLQMLLRQSHSLKGSGATYGFAGVSVTATQLYTLLGKLLEQQQLPDIHEKDQITTLLKSLKESDFSEDYNFNLPILDEEDRETVPASENLGLIIVMQDRHEADELVDQLQPYGYDITVLTADNKLGSSIKHINPFAIIIDISLHAMTEVIDEQELENTIPTIFLSAKDDIETRLQAVRAGCTNFFSKPIHTPDLIDTLEKINQKQIEEPNRILIVEDTRSLALFYEAALQSAGMTTCVINDPMQVLEVLPDFNPELILMDMYMPGCDGQELAAVIRQHESYVSIPIVYLSSEQDMSKQLEAMHHGGDDFLTKPIDPEHLIKSVETRTKRYRRLRSQMVRDSLTGLYNHTKTKELLEQDLYRCARNDTLLVFAMLDIDKFKSVNDTYGHPVGDKVIKSLARILKQRLRKSDTIGRYGGEEFAIVLYDTDINSATTVMNEIRDNFSLLSHSAGDTEFNVTFSCGLAAYPYFDTAAELNEAADKALYQAKESGRNCVVVADPSVL